MSILSSETLSQTPLDLEDFATASRLFRQRNSTTVELVDNTCDARHAVARRSMQYMYTHRAQSLPQL